MTTFYPLPLPSHYHAVAVIVPPASTLNTLPDVEFPTYQSIDNVYSSECEPPSRSTAYIAAEFSHDEFDSDTVTIQFTFGDDSETLNDNPRYDNNGPLCYSTKYAFFLRVYNDVVSENVLYTCTYGHISLRI